MKKVPKKIFAIAEITILRLILDESGNISTRRPKMSAITPILNESLFFLFERNLFSEYSNRKFSIEYSFTSGEY